LVVLIRFHRTNHKKLTKTATRGNGAKQQIGIESWYDTTDPYAIFASTTDHSTRKAAMALQDPIAAYNAANPDEATLLCQALIAEGIEAHVIDDVSQTGGWLGGLVPELNKTQIWIERVDADRARTILEAYERRSAELNQIEATEADAGLPPIRVTCDSCGAVTEFAGHLKGSVQSCGECGAYLDVGEISDDSGEWAAESAEPGGEEDQETEQNTDDKP